VSKLDRIAVREKDQQDRVEIRKSKTEKLKQLSKNMQLMRGKFVGEESVFMRSRNTTNMSFFEKIKEKYTVESLNHDGELMFFNSDELFEILRLEDLCIDRLQQNWVAKIPTLRNH